MYKLFQPSTSCRSSWFYIKITTLCPLPSNKRYRNNKNWQDKTDLKHATDPLSWQLNVSKCQNHSFTTSPQSRFVGRSPCHPRQTEMRSILLQRVLKDTIPLQPHRFVGNSRQNFSRYVAILGHPFSKLNFHCHRTTCWGFYCMGHAACPSFFHSTSI